MAQAELDNTQGDGDLRRSTPRVKRQQGYGTAEVAQALRDLITSRQLSPGESIPQAEMAAKLGVSRTPLREALGLLSAEGLVMIRPNRGAIVLKPTAVDMKDIYGIRIALETLGAELGAERISDAQILGMQSLQDQMHQSTSWHEYLPLNHKFHSELYEAAGRPRLSQMIQTVRLQSEPYWTSGSSADLERSHSEHDQLIAALRRRDGPAAAGITRHHLQLAAEYAAAALAGPPA